MRITIISNQQSGLLHWIVLSTNLLEQSFKDKKHTHSIKPSRLSDQNKSNTVSQLLPLSAVIIFN